MSFMDMFVNLVVFELLREYQPLWTIMRSGQGEKACVKSSRLEKTSSNTVNSHLAIMDTSIIGQQLNSTHY